jgi:hypothetical protein
MDTARPAKMSTCDTLNVRYQRICAILPAMVESASFPSVSQPILRDVPTTKVGIPDKARRFGSSPFSGYPFFRSRTHVCAFPPLAQHQLCPTARLGAQEYRLRLKRLSPKALPWFPPFKSSTPESFRGSCASRLFCAVANGNAQISVLERKIALRLIFPSKTESNGFLVGGRTGKRGPNETVTAIQLTKLNANWEYYS